MAVLLVASSGVSRVSMTCPLFTRHHDDSGQCVLPGCLSEVVTLVNEPQTAQSGTGQIENVPASCMWWVVFVKHLFQLM